MVLTFGGHLWCAASGMEVVPFAFVLTRAFRKASEWSERGGSENDDTKKTPRDFWELAALGWAAFLFRPEGAVAVIAIALVFVLFPRSKEIVHRVRDGAIAVAGPALVLVFLRLATGTASTSTASVKLLFGNPYYRGDAFVAAVEANVHVFFDTLLKGEVWSAEFIPSGGSAFAIAGLFAIALCGQQTKKYWRAAFVLVLALEMLAPTTYVTFLWNRLRYLWPFATGWLIGLACLAKVTGDALGQIRASWKITTPILVGLFAGAFLTRLGGVVDDVATSASGIDRQHVVLGNWAKTNIPEGARIGVNDTGAIAYFGDHPTFDVVGLTTPGEGKYWVAGAGSRYEHYERLKATAPDRLPKFFVVYPEWMSCDPVLGAEIYEATVTDSTILGGQTMRVYVADYDLLGEGEAHFRRAGERGRECLVVGVQRERRSLIQIRRVRFELERASRRGKGDCRATGAKQLRGVGCERQPGAWRERPGLVGEQEDRPAADERSRERADVAVKLTTHLPFGENVAAGSGWDVPPSESRSARWSSCSRDRSRCSSASPRKGFA